MEYLNEKEKAAILLHIFEDRTGRGILFEIAEGENRANRLRPNENSYKVTASKWFRSHKIQEGIKYYLNLLEEIKQKAIQDYINSLVEAEPGEGKKATQAKNAVNFLNPDEFLQFANDQANEITDEKERREYLKMIANLMNYKDSDAESIDIQRFYTPIICQECEIYKKCSRCNLETCKK